MKHEFFLTSLILANTFKSLSIEDGSGGGGSNSGAPGGAGTATIAPPVTTPGTSPTLPTTTPSATTIPATPPASTIPPATVSPEIAALWNQNSAGAKPAVEIMAPYFGGKTGSKETSQKMFTADAQLASNLFFSMLEGVSGSPVLVDHIIKNDPETAKAIALKLGYQPGNGTTIPTSGVQSPVINTPAATPEIASLQESIKAQQARIDQLTGKITEYDTRTTEEKVASVFSEAKTKNETFASTALGNFVKLDAVDQGTKNILLKSIGADMDNDKVLVNAFNKYVQDSYEGNSISAQNQWDVVEAKTTEIIKRNIGEIGPTLLKNNQALIGQLNLQGNLRQPGVGGGGGAGVQTANTNNIAYKSGDVAGTLKERAMANFNRNRAV